MSNVEWAAHSSWATFSETFQPIWSNVGSKNCYNFTLGDRKCRQTDAYRPLVVALEPKSNASSRTLTTTHYRPTWTEKSPKSNLLSWPIVEYISNWFLMTFQLSKFFVSVSFDRFFFQRATHLRRLHVAMTRSHYKQKLELWWDREFKLFSWPSGWSRLCQSFYAKRQVKLLIKKTSEIRSNSDSCCMLADLRAFNFLFFHLYSRSRESTRCNDKKRANDVDNVD